MNHVPEAGWAAYLADEIPEALKIEYENHLYSCDKCLSAYMEAMEKEETSLDIEGFDIAGPVMDSINRLKGGAVEEAKQHRKENSARTITRHYLIAAGFTILLMAGGVFQSLTEYVDTVESSSDKKTQSLTDGLIDKTFNWMDTIEKKNKEGFRNE
jgi:anti-sigma factor RsiW